MHIALILAAMICCKTVRPRTSRASMTARATAAFIVQDFASVTLRYRTSCSKPTRTMSEEISQAWKRPG
jgi:hypothetical protein